MPNDPDENAPPPEDREPVPEREVSNRDNGRRFRRAVAEHLASKYAGRLLVYEEVPIGSSIIGKRRKVDMLVVASDFRRAAALEAKYQSAGGTTDEKIPYALADCEAMHVPATVVYAGGGWSPGVLHMLAASAYAVHVKADAPDRIADASELDVFLAEVFGFWETVVANRTPVKVKERGAEEVSSDGGTTHRERG